MKKTLLAAAIICAGTFLSARGAQEIVKTGHWVYDAMTAVALEGGYTDFTLRSPMTIQEISTYLEKTDYEKLSEAGKKQFDRIREYIAFEPALSVGEDVFKISMTADANLEGYYKSNDDLEWNFDRYGRKHVITAPMIMNVADYASFGMETILGQNNAAMAKNDNYSNVSLLVDDCDLDFPDFAYFAAGAKITEKTGVSLQIAKGESSFNRSLSGSVTESEYFTGSTYVDLSAYSPNFRYKMNVDQFNVDKYMYTHEWGFIFWNKLQLTAREALLVYAPMELRYLNPIGIYHGFAPWRDYDSDGSVTTGGESHTCDLLSFKIEYTPAKYTRLYGVFAMDQFQMPNENSETDCTPRAMAFQAGSESYIPYGQGYVHLWLEGTYTDPFMYIKGSPNWSLMRSYRESVSTERNKAIYEWYGTPWGPDTAGGQLSVSYEVPAKWSLGFDYLFKACGEYSGMRVFDEYLNKGKKNSERYNENNRDEFNTSGDWVYPNPDRDKDGTSTLSDDAKKRQSYTGPHGTVKYVNRIAIKGTYFVNPDFSVSFCPAFTAVFNNGHVTGNKDYGWEAAISATYMILK